MKKLAYVAAVAVLFAACTSTNKKADNSAMKTELLNALDGTWVMTDYITELQKTKSPLASSAVLKGIVSMIVSKPMATGDTLPVSASLNNHEGMSFNMILQQGAGDKQVLTDISAAAGNSNTYELGYEINNADTFALLYEYDKDKKEVSRRRFTKVRGHQTENSEPYGIQYMANKTLMAGNYSATDDKGQTSNISFSDDGLLDGVEGHNTYYIFTDFIGEEEGYLVDELCFDERTKQQKPFIFKINKDTVWLYQAKENTERTKLEQGPLKYILVRK